MSKYAMFIDGANTWHTTQKLNFRVDFNKLRQFFSDKGELAKAYYFDSYSGDSNQNNEKRNFFEILESASYKVVSKQSKVWINSQGDLIRKGNMDVEMTIGVMSCINKGYDEIILFTGDGDFIPLVREIQKYGIKITIVSCVQLHCKHCSSELLRTADKFIDLSDIQKYISLKRNKN